MSAHFIHGMRVFLAEFVNVLSTLLVFAIFARVVFSWFRVDMSGNGIFRMLYESTEPILRIVRRITPRLGMIDISPIIAFLAIDIARALLLTILSTA